MAIPAGSPELSAPDYETERPVQDDPLIDAPERSWTRPNIVAVIPAYNEEVAIGSVVLGALQYVDHVIVVDDCSSDKTAKVAELAGAQVIRLSKNYGKAKAVLTGLREAERTTCRVAVMLDGDGQHRSEDIANVTLPIINGEADMVIGSRFLGEQKDIPGYRVLGQKIINSLSNAGAKVDVTDSQSGLRGLSRRALRNLNFRSDGYNLESDMITHFVEEGLSIKEVPISVRYDVPNGHKKGSVSMGMGLLGNVVSTIGYKRPLLMFGVPGATITMMGFILGLMAALELHYFFIPVWQVLISIGMVLVGVFFCVSALTLNSLILLMKSNSR